MAHEWELECVTTREMAESLIRRRWPDLEPVSARGFGKGWDNIAFLINESLVFRFPCRKIAIPLMETEISLLPWLAARLPLRIPNPSFAATPSAEYPYPFSGYNRISGRTLTDRAMSNDERKSIVQPLGEFLAALHAVPSGEAREHGAPEDTLRRLDPHIRKARTAGRLEALAKAGLLHNSRQIGLLLDSLPVIKAPSSGTLVHGDLHSNQILVDDGHRLAGIIDWGDTHVGDPAVDFAGVQAMLPLEAHEAFIRAYGSVDPVAWAAARGRALWHTVALLAQAAETRDAPAIREALACLDRLVRRLSASDVEDWESRRRSVCGLSGHS